MNPPDRTIIYRISRNGHVMGEFDIDRVVELLDSGELLWTDLCWAQGMAGWGPLSGLRAEIAAAKAFPPVAAMPTPVASGRRRMQPPPPQAVAPQPASSGVAGWAWIVGGVTLGALVGLLTTHLFPNVVMVDRPVEKIVEKPVEVIRTVEKPVEIIRTVEKRVEVPANLTIAQQEALDFVQKRDDALRREVGMGPTSMVPVFDKKIRVFVESQANSNAVAPSSVRARVESVLRRNGFQIIPESNNDDFASTLIVASIECVDPEDKVQIIGSISLTVSQYGLFAGGRIQKHAWVTMNKYGMTIQYGSRNFYRIPELFDDFAVRASNDLLKAGQLPYSK